MKIIKIINHPVTLIISFLFVIIIGQHIVGFYLWYILLALPHGGIHAILAAVGVSILLFINYRNKREYTLMIEPLLNIIASIMLMFSLYLFFYNDKEGYNNGTFYDAVPVTLLTLFVILSLSFIIRNLIKLFHSGNYIKNVM